ncbi:ATP-binding protein [Streptosporangium sp. NBC_01469]|uniref:ATP-binding protein n=1 Tax=Streptosporangium sp. NBC_01469 TaxID=2903898 RepID=UPI002E2A3182|nr:AAA family ATPase [Streptosporangium sp. NBC_01469]
MSTRPPYDSSDRPPAKAARSAAGKRVVSPTLVGRVEELATLVAAVAGPPAVVSIEGEAGVGKTRLVSELLGRPEVAGRRALLGRCHRFRESFPLGPVIEAVRGIGDELRGMRLSGVAGALRPLLPELAEMLPAAPDPLDDRMAERHRVFRGLADVLVAVSPAVLVLEDLHWAEEQTTDFIAYLLGSPPPGLTVVLTYRGEEVSAAVRASTVRLPPGTSQAHLVLAPLDQGETGALATAILDTERVSEEFAHYLWERTAGLPFAVEEVLALVRERGSLVRRGDRWTRRVLEELEVPRGVRDSTLERIARLPADAHRLAEAAAVLHTPVALSVLLSVAEDAGRIEGLEEAVGSGLLIEDGEAFGFRHTLAAQAVYETLSGPRRRELHGRAADALRALDPVLLGQVAHHLKHADRLAEWAAAAEQAAGQAVALGHEDEAVRLLAEVVRHAPMTGERRGQVAVRLGWAALDTLRAREVVPLLDHALDDDLAGPVRGELRFLMALALGQAGQDSARQRELFMAAIDDLQDRPDLRAWALVGLGVTPRPNEPIRENVRWLSRALELVDEVDDRLLEVFVLGKAGSVFLDIGDPAWRDVTDRMLKITGGSPQQRREANAHCSVGISACYAGHFDMAESMLSSGLRASAVQQNRRLEVMLRSGLTLVRYCRGSWNGLRGDVDDLLADVAHYAPSLMDVELAGGNLNLAYGAVDQADEQLRRVTELAVEIGAYEVVPAAAGGWARARLALGDTQGALHCVQLLLHELDRWGCWPSAGWALPSAVEVWAAAGEYGEARRFTERVERELRHLDAPLASAALCYARGVLDGRADDFLTAAVKYQNASAPYEAARASERAAGLLLDGGDPRGGSVLRDAVAVYERLGASWDHGRAAGVARWHEVALPARHRGGRQGYGARLSPRERQVAELAAHGRTNKEIAQALFVSAKTVEKHLAAVMRKLSARSRTELERLLEDAASKDGGFPNS